MEFSQLWPHQRAVELEHYVHELGLRDRASGERVELPVDSLVERLLDEVGGAHRARV